jgi:hypothetical protein
VEGQRQGRQCLSGVKERGSAANDRLGNGVHQGARGILQYDQSSEMDGNVIGYEVLHRKHLRCNSDVSTMVHGLCDGSRWVV